MKVENGMKGEKGRAAQSFEELHRGLVNQIRHAATSIVSNIPEGFERGSNTEFIQFLYIAKGSCGEVRAQLQIALDQHYVSPLAFERLQIWRARQAACSRTSALTCSNPTTRVRRLPGRNGSRPSHNRLALNRFARLRKQICTARAGFQTAMTSKVHPRISDQSVCARPFQFFAPFIPSHFRSHLDS
jgi:four helix bundle protein